MLIHQLLIDGAKRRPNSLAFHWIDRGRTLTYAEAAEQMERFAGAISALGVKKGDRVTIVAHNGMDYLLSMFGCWRIGAIAALVNVKFADELEYYFADHEPKIVIYTHDLVAAVGRAAATVGSIQTLVCMDGPQQGAESLPALLAAAPPAPSDPDDEDAIAHLSYTSGTTGRPKGACLAHEPTVRAARCIAERLKISSDDIAFGPTALSSSYQLIANLLPGLHHAIPIAVMRRWTPETGWQKLDETGSTLLAANPTFLADVLHQSRLKGRPPRGLRLGLSGGGPVPLPLKRSWRDELKLPLVESYGQSELGGFVALGSPELLPDARLAAIGRPLPDKEVRVLDEAGYELPIGEIGELCIRGGFMKGYWGKPDKTAEATRGGWLHTGDAGTMDLSGMIIMRGRFSELFSVAKRTWFPRDVEEALCSSPGVQAAAVVGLPAHDLGHRPVAFVIFDGEDFDPAALKQRIQGILPYDLNPLDIFRVKEFPMTPTGKIAKAELRDQAIAGTVGVA
jgi:acyl-CoA synthetase (AMP-forming)/AMP-acid ligase II